MHSRVCLHQVAFLGLPTEVFVEHCRSLGIAHMTLVSQAFPLPDRAWRTLRRGGPRVTSVNHVFAVHPDLERDTGEAGRRLLEVVDTAAELGAERLYLLTGGRGGLTWEQAADRFADLLGEGREAAEAAGVRLLVENASPFNADIHMAHTLSDAITLAERAGIGVCIDLHACWMEADLRGLIERAAPHTGLVQVSDYVLGDRTAPCRAVPGDGTIDLPRILGDILATGYGGVFDIELVGPRIDAEGAEPATTRAAHHLSELLTRLGA